MSYREWSQDNTKGVDMLTILDFVVNRVPIIAKINGSKRQIAGVLIAVSAVALSTAPLIPAPYDVSALAIAELLKQVAEVFGVWGVAGVLTKDLAPKKS